jgi:peptidylprolyl isomerase
VRFVGSGRAQIDFNHRYAGRTLEYNFTVVKKIEDNKEMINEIIDRRIPNSVEKITVDIEQNIANIKIPDEYFLLEGLQIIKRAIANEIMKYVKDVNEVSYIEQFKGTQNNDKNKVEESTEQETSTDDSNIQNESTEEKVE